MTGLHFSGDDDAHSPARCRKRAMDALARREHSRAELERKLGDAGFDADTVAATLDQLAADGLQNDARFVESFVSSRYRRGKGPSRIRAELRERGIPGAAVDRAIADSGLDWVALATDVRSRKFGLSAPPDFPARARQMRFLHYRGFSSEQIDAALEARPGSN
jgi:regulatory protein